MYIKGVLGLEDNEIIEAAILESAAAAVSSQNQSKLTNASSVFTSGAAADLITDGLISSTAKVESVYDDDSDCNPVCKKVTKGQQNEVVPSAAVPKTYRISGPVSEMKHEGKAKQQQQIQQQILPFSTAAVLAACNSLALADSAIVGDPTEKTAVESIKWNIRASEIKTI